MTGIQGCDWGRDSAICWFATSSVGCLRSLLVAHLLSVLACLLFVFQPARHVAECRLDSMSPSCLAFFAHLAPGLNVGMDGTVELEHGPTDSCERHYRSILTSRPSPHRCRDSVLNAAEQATNRSRGTRSMTFVDRLCNRKAHSLVLDKSSMTCIHSSFPALSPIDQV